MHGTGTEIARGILALDLGLLAPQCRSPLLPWRFGKYLVQQLVRRAAVGEFNVVAIKVIHTVEPAVFRQDVLFGDVDSEGVRAVAPLKLDLAFAREEPVHEQLGGVRMRRVIDQADRASARAQRSPFLQLEDLSQRETLLDRLLRFARVARYAEREFTRREPVDRLAVVARDRQVHLAVEPPYEFGAELGVVVKK